MRKPRKDSTQTKARLKLTALFPAGIERLRRGATLWIETTLIIVLAVAICLWIAPADPFGINAQFPWLLIVPLVVAMRYGTVIGIYASVLVVAAWALLPFLGLAPLHEVFPKAYFLGGVIIVLIAGQFADIWNSRLEKIKEVNAYIDARLSSLTRNHYLLRLSHERIEQDLLIRPTTLRDLLLELRTQVSTQTGALPGATEFMRLLAQSCEVECAGLFVPADPALGVAGGWQRQPIAQLAEAQDLLLADPLVVRALETRSLTHPQEDANLDDSRYLTVIPLVTGNRKTIGVVAIERMPFFGLNNENLQLMLVLAGYLADGVEAAKAIRPILALRSDCPPDFALEMVRLQRMRRNIQVESALVILSVPNQRDLVPVFEHIKRQKRTTDLTWEIDTQKSFVWVTLLPLSGSASTEGYLSRIEETMKLQLDVDFSTGRVAIHTSMLSSAEPEWVLDDLLNRAGVASMPLFSEPVPEQIETVQ
jgi:polysaccharide biosynthesis protein PelD